MKAAILFLLFGIKAFAQPPIPTVPLITKAAYAITMVNTNTNSDEYRLSDWYLRGIIEPTYYGIAISNLFRQDQLLVIISNANKLTPKLATTVADPPPITTNRLAYSNQPTAYRLAVGMSNWNIFATSLPSYYPGYNLQTAATVQSKHPTAFTNLQQFPAGSPGFTNNYSSTNPQRFFRIIYAQ